MSLCRACAETRVQCGQTVFCVSRAHWNRVRSSMPEMRQLLAVETLLFFTTFVYESMTFLCGCSFRYVPWTVAMCVSQGAPCAASACSHHRVVTTSFFSGPIMPTRCVVWIRHGGWHVPLYVRSFCACVCVVCAQSSMCVVKGDVRTQYHDPHSGFKCHQTKEAPVKSNVVFRRTPGTESFAHELIAGFIRGLAPNCSWYENVVQTCSLC